MNSGMWRKAAAGVTGLLLLVIAVPNATGDEPPEAGCPVVAAAQGVQLMVTASDNVALEVPTGVGVPVSQSCVNYGLGESRGFASNPYPGETGVALSKIVGGRLGQELPAYPAYAASRYPGTDESKVSQDGYKLISRSTKTASESLARSGADSEETGAGRTVASAESVVDPEKRSSIATATSDISPVSIKGVLELGKVHSMARAIVDADGKVKRAAALRVGHTKVAGQEVVITPEGVEVADKTVALRDAPDPDDVLKEAGVRVRYLEKVETRQGVLSAGIEVIAEMKTPDTSAVYTAHYTFGRAFAAADVVPEGPGDLDSDFQVPLGVAGTGGESEAGAGDMGDSSGPAEVSGPDVAEAAAGEGEAPEEAEPPEVEAVPQRSQEAVLVSQPVDMGMAGLYLVIVFAGVATVAGGTLLRLLGVRTRWTS